MDKITGPKEFFLELRSLFQSLSAEKDKGSLNLETLDALARVLSWIPNMEAR